MVSFVQIHMGAAVERHTPQPGSYLDHVSQVARSLPRSNDALYPPYKSALAFSIARGIESFGSLGILSSQIIPPAEILLRVENPHDQFTQEIGMLAARIADIVPEAQPRGNRRARDQQTQEAVIRFQDGFVGIIEELINGTTATGEPTQLRLLSQIAQYGLQQVPAAMRAEFFVGGQDGRLHLQNTQEMSAVANARQIGIVKKLGVLPEEPITPRAAVAGLAAEIACGILGGYHRSLDKAAENRGRIGNAWNWVYDHKRTSLTQVLDGRLVKIFASIMPQRAEQITRINGYRTFIVDDLPKLLPAVMGVLPEQPQHIDAFRQIIHGLKALITA